MATIKSKVTESGKDLFTVTMGPKELATLEAVIADSLLLYSDKNLTNVYDVIQGHAPVRFYVENKSELVAA